MRNLIQFSSTSDKQDFMNNTMTNALTFVESQSSKIVEIRSKHYDEIWYTSTDGSVVAPYKSNAFNVNIVSNTYSDGKGVIKFDGKLTTIGAEAFRGLSALASVILPDSVTVIGNYAFYGCGGITHINLPERLKTIGNQAFYNLTKWSDDIIIPSTVTSIGTDAFSWCYNIKSLVIGKSVTNIVLGAFRATGTHIKSIKVDPDNNVYDSRGGCNCLIETATGTLVTGCGNSIIPEGVKILGESCFYYIGIISLNIPSTVTTVGSQCFGYNGTLRNLTVSTGNKIFDSRDNCNAIIETATNTLVEGSNTTVIPETVVALKASCFYGRTGLTTINIPQSLISISNSAFTYCINLRQITVDENNEVYDSRNNCNAIIETATNTLIGGCNGTIIPNTVEKIGDNAFYLRINLKTLTLPSSVTSLGSSCFTSSGITSLTVENTVPPTLLSTSLSGLSSSCVIYVPAESVDTYKSAQYWSNRASQIQAIVS